MLSVCSCSTIMYKETISDNFANLRISIMPPELGDKYRIDTWLYQGDSLKERSRMYRFASIVGRSFPPIVKKSKFRKVPTDAPLSLRIEGQIVANNTYFFRHDILFSPKSHKMYEIEIVIIDKFPVGKYDSSVYEIDIDSNSRCIVESIKSKPVDIHLELELPESRALYL